MNVTWIIDTNMGENSDIHAYAQSVRDSGAKVIEIKYIPFSDEMPTLEVAGPIVLYGSINFIKMAQKSSQFALGIFGDEHTFTYEAWAEHYGNMLLNSPDTTSLSTIEAFSFDERNPSDDIFVRPQHDTKSLIGRVWRAGEFRAWCEEAKKGLFAGVDKDTPIVIGTPYGIEAEWRLFVVDNQVVGASQYHKHGKLCKVPGAPQDILDFAQKVIDTWSPVPAYTLDICKSAGNCYIVEAQGFNSAGQYACDVRAVATAVNEVAIKLYQNSIRHNYLKF